jgi:hypothetical protein
MSLEAIQQEVATWPKPQVRKLQAYLVSLQREADEETMQRLTAKIDDNDPSHWVSLEDMAKRLGLDQE